MLLGYFIRDIRRCDKCESLFISPYTSLKRFEYDDFTSSSVEVWDRKTEVYSKYKPCIIFLNH